MRVNPVMKPVASLILVMFASLVPVPGCASTPARASVSEDLRELIESARGAQPALCACAARSVNNWGWVDAPASPLGRPVAERPFERRRLADEDVAFLLSSLDTPDPCVRELAVRLVAGARREEVATGLLQRLGAPDSSLRMTAALGLG